MGDLFGPDGNGNSMILMVGMVGVMYFFMIRPQQKKAKKLKDLRASLTIGSVIITAGGIHGKIVDVQENTVTLDVDRGTKLTIEKSSISGNLEESA